MASAERLRLALLEVDAGRQPEPEPEATERWTCGACGRSTSSSRQAHALYCRPRDPAVSKDPSRRVDS